MKSGDYMTNEELVILIQAGIDTEENMETLYHQVKSFIHTIAWKYRNSGEMEDLEQEGYLALYPAIAGYDPAAGYLFLTYAEYHIRQKMHRYLQNNSSCVRLPVQSQERVRQYKKFYNWYQSEYGREPTDASSAAHLGLTVEQVENIRKNDCMALLCSLDSPITGKDGAEGGTVGDLIASSEDMEGEVLDRVQYEELCAVLWDCVDSLPGKQAETIRARYKDGLTLKETGERIGTTLEAARQWEAKGLRELRKPSRARRLRPFLPEADRIYSMGIRELAWGRFIEPGQAPRNGRR